MSAYTVLMTKRISPELVRKAKEQDVELHEMDFIKIVPCDELEKVNEIAQKPSCVVFTSRNSVLIVSRFLKDKRPDWRIFCIDGSTRQEVETCFGATSIAGTAKNAAALANVISEKDSEKEIVFFCGDKRRDALPDQLQDEDIDVREVIVYETKLFPEEVGQHFDGIAFFSPSAVESFFSVNIVDDKTVFFSLGPTTTECLEKFAKYKVITCDTASEEHMVETILRNLKQANEQSEE